jgi:hypothetical protein
MRKNMMLRSCLLLSIGAVLLAGCTGRGFQPPPPEFTNWKKSGVSQEGVKSAMTACGYTNLIGTGDATPIDQVLKRFYCMKDSGFKRTDNIDLCKEGRIGESPVCEGRR